MNKHGNTTHGMALMGRQYYSKRHPVYISWVNMRQRCNNPNRPDYKYYGGKGIKVCKRWNSFSNFLHDMGEPQEGLTLDRIDVYKDYTPSNCKWATREEQSNNRTDNPRITYNGKTMTIGQWAACLPIGISAKNLYKRVYTRGWSIEKAFTQAVRHW